MTTPAAAALYEAQHVYMHEGLRCAIYNPNNLPIDQLPVIYGFNNGGSPGWMHAVLIAADGKCLGSHICTSEGYMPADLGVLEGTRPDRHETFREHYPQGYRMEFVGYPDVRTHAGLAEAYRLNQANKEEPPQC